MISHTADLTPNVELNPSQYSLYAANKASLDVIGDTVIPFVIDGHAFEADVSVCSKVDDFLLGSDWLEKQKAKWDFVSGTVTLGDRCIKVHRRQRTNICRRVIVAADCIVPAKHEANVPVRMEDDGLSLPPCDWAIEPQGLGPSIMTARTLFSNTQMQLVAHVLNNSAHDKTLSANSFLSMAEPVKCLSDTDSSKSSCLTDSDNPFCDSVPTDESVIPVSFSSPPSTVTAGETALRLASSVSTATVDASASDSSISSSEDGMEHIEGLLHSLPDNLTLNQKQRAETFIRSRANVFSHPKTPLCESDVARGSTGFGVRWFTLAAEDIPCLLFLLFHGCGIP